MKILDIAFKDITRSFRSVFAIGMMVIAPTLDYSRAVICQKD